MAPWVEGKCEPHFLSPSPTFRYPRPPTLVSTAALLTFLPVSSSPPPSTLSPPAQGWSIALHALSRGNAEVSGIVMDALSKECGMLGLISAVPFSIATRIKFHNQTDDSPGGLFGGGGGGGARPTSAWVGGGDKGDKSARPRTAVARTASMAPAADKSTRRASLAFLGGKDDDGQLLPDMRQGSNLRDVLVQKSKASFSQQLKKVAVEMVTEARDQDHMALIQNNAVALSLNSKSSECVQVGPHGRDGRELDGAGCGRPANTV
jgi:hypothetical protein